jgi:hypothetical protein
MVYYAVKVIVSALMIVVVSELSRRFTILGALIASLPLVSLLAMVWLYVDTGDVSQVSKLSLNIFWMVIPSLGLFMLFPVLLQAKISFYVALFVSCVITALGYWVMLYFVN